MGPDKLQRKKLVPLLLVSVLSSQCRGICVSGNRVGGGISQLLIFSLKWHIFGSTDWRAMNSVVILSLLSLQTFLFSSHKIKKLFV